jgi:hypothetical protein
MIDNEWMVSWFVYFPVGGSSPSCPKLPQVKRFWNIVAAVSWDDLDKDVKLWSVLNSFAFLLVVSPTTWTTIRMNLLTDWCFPARVMIVSGSHLSRSPLSLGICMRRRR